MKQSLKRKACLWLALTFVSSGLGFAQAPEPVAEPILVEKANGPLIPVPTCTLLDTRRRVQGPALTSDLQRAIQVHGRKCRIPETAKAASVRATIFQPSGKGNLRFYRGDQTAPRLPAGVLRFARPGQSVSRALTVPISKDCAIAVLPFVAGQGTVHLLLEVNGYYE